MLRFAFLLVLTFAFALPASVHADKGVALDVGTVVVQKDLSRGGKYNLPPIGVRNPGDEVTSYRMTVDYVQDQEARRPPADWFRFEPSEFTLHPGEQTRVRIALHVHSGANADDFEALVVASIFNEQEGTSVGGAAAARLAFTVKSSNFFDPWFLRIGDWFGDYAPWSYLTPGLIALLVFLWLMRRRFSFRIERRQ
jgi:hypothetical protein